MGKEHKTISGKIIATIVHVAVNAFKEIFPDLIDKVYNDLKPELRQEISWITQIVSKINDVLENPALDIIVLAIPGTKDDDFLKWARIIASKFDTLDELTNEGKALMSAKLTKDRTGMKLSQALMASQAVYEKENS